MQLRSYAQFARFASSSLPEATTKTAWQRRSIMNINYHLLFHFYTVLFFTSATKNESNKTHCTVLQGWMILVSKNKHKNSTTFAVRCANCLVWLCLLALVTVPTLLGLLYIYMSASPEIIVPDTIPGTITTGDTQNDLSFGLALCGIGILLACVACLETTVFFDWLEKWCKTCNFTEGRSFLRTAVPIQWNGFFVSIIWCHSCNILLGIKNTSINLRPVFVKLAHHTKNPWKIHPPWALTFQGGCLQSPDHQIGFDQYRRSGRLYSTDAYAVHSVPRFGVKKLAWRTPGFEWNPLKNGYGNYMVWWENCHVQVFWAGKRFRTIEV